MNELDPIDDELRQLLDVERARPPVAPHMRARLLSRVEASALAGAAGFVAGATVAGATVGGTTTASTTAGAPSTSAVLGKVATKGWLAIVLAFAIGGAVGAGVTHATRAHPPPVERVVYVEKRVEVIVPASGATSGPDPGSGASGVAEDLSAWVPSPLAASPTPGSHSASASGVSGVSAKAEQQAIDAIRAALMRKDSAAALAAVSAHEARFPKGQQVEEREALAVQALSLSGRTADAKVRAERFLKSWPKSLFRANVEKVLAP